MIDVKKGDKVTIHGKFYIYNGYEKNCYWFENAVCFIGIKENMIEYHTIIKEWVLNDVRLEK